MALSPLHPTFNITTQDETLRIVCRTATVVSEAGMTHQYCVHHEQSTLVFYQLEDANEIVRLFVSFWYHMMSHHVCEQASTYRLCIFLYFGPLIALPVS
jgi:hypothetical protein